MTDDEKPPELTEEQIVEIMRMQLAASLSQLAADFAPHFPRKKLGDLVDYMLAEQQTVVNEILPGFVDMAVYAKRTQLYVNIQIQGEGGEVREATFPGLKRIEMARGDPQLAIVVPMMLAFLLSPAARALLRMHGYNYTFTEPKNPKSPTAPKLTIVGN